MVSFVGLAKLYLDALNRVLPANGRYHKQELQVPAFAAGYAGDSASVSFISNGYVLDLQVDVTFTVIVACTMRGNDIEFLLGSQFSHGCCFCRRGDKAQHNGCLRARNISNMVVDILQGQCGKLRRYMNLSGCPLVILHAEFICHKKP